jgi:excisionase family DNA binding protein
MNATTERLLTTHEAAEMLGISRHTLRRLVVVGVVEQVKLHKRAHPRYRMSDLRHLVACGCGVADREGP